MAWIFSLSAECGSDQSNVNQFAQHFEGRELILSNGRQCLCCTDIFQDGLQNWWCRVYPNNIWQLYEGEVYNPLMASPDLKNKLNQLLAVNLI